MNMERTEKFNSLWSIVSDAINDVLSFILYYKSIWQILLEIHSV